jgi:hypothetical protein
MSPRLDPTTSEIVTGFLREGKAPRWKSASKAEQTDALSQQGTMMAMPEVMVAQKVPPT